MKEFDSLNFQDLHINNSDLENFLALDLLTGLSVDIYRGIFLKSRKHLFSIIVTAIIAFSFSLFFFTAIILIIFRNTGKIDNDSSGFIHILSLSIFLSLIFLAIFNIYLWRKLKQVKSLSILLTKIDTYNNSLEDIQILYQLQNFNPKAIAVNLPEHDRQFFQILQATKESLIDALKVEKIIRENLKTKLDYAELSQHLENNLITLMSVQDNTLTEGEEKLFQQIIQIGLSVHKEIRNLNK